MIDEQKMFPLFKCFNHQWMIKYNSTSCLYMAKTILNNLENDVKILIKSLCDTHSNSTNKK